MAVSVNADREDGTRVVAMDEGEEEVPLVEDVEDGVKKDTPSSPRKPRASHLAEIVRTVLILGNIMAWYITNGMNGIALQSFAGHVREFRDGSEELAFNTCIMALVTAAQLFFGAIVGLVMMWFTSLLRPSKRGQRFQSSIPKDEVILGSLHSLGSISTNLGFMYGSASLVQILKLLEPFETLFLSQLLIPDEGKFTAGVFSSMTLVVGAAVSLIRIRPTKPHPHAVLFALLSGLSLSSRNVLQRKQHVQVSDENDNKMHMSKLDRSLEQFTKLSFHSAVMTSMIAVLLNGVLLTTSPTHVAAVKAVVSQAINWRILTWHPLYNTFSMITLGFCSALTHSLLNAGKRVFAIVMAIVWFREDFTMATIGGLTAVAGGGCWYTIESKQKRPGQWFKLAVAVGLLVTLLQFQSSSKRVTQET